MRGGVFHEFLLDQLEGACRQAGLQTRRQVASKRALDTLYIDLLVSHDSLLLLIEVEMDSRRAANDVRKRRDLGHDATLWIVTPTEELAQSIRRRLRRTEIDADESIFVLPFFAALRRISSKEPFCTPVEVQNTVRKQKHQNPRKTDER